MGEGRLDVPRTTARPQEHIPLDPQGPDRLYADRHVPQSAVNGGGGWGEEEGSGSLRDKEEDVMTTWRASHMKCGG